MTHVLRTPYQPLEGRVTSIEDMDDFSPDTNLGMLIHVVPEGSRKRWNHIEDLDSFFTRIYQYHQRNGFMCMVLQSLFELAQFIFVISFTTFLFCFVNYDVLFRNKLPPGDTHDDKISLADCVHSFEEAKKNFSWKIVFFLVLATMFWLIRLGSTIMNFFFFWEIKKFYNTALKIQDSDLNNVTWDEVQHRVMEVQTEQRMCIHKETLTELDIYHRILRFPNYLLAMVNNNVIPLKHDLPFFGEYVFLTKGLKYNIEMLMFWGPWAPFKNNWHLKDDFKRADKKKELSEDLQKRILYVGLFNLVLFPVVFLWQILYTFFYYADVIKREPGSLGSRRWSHYGRLYLRHFNELDHELRARLNRGYRAASQYMNIFLSPHMTVIARHMAFVFGSVFAVFAILTVYDEDVIHVEHVLAIMTIAAAVIAGCHVFIPDENLVWCPELLLKKVLSEVHYMPVYWQGKAHTSFVRNEFSRLFQYKVVHVIEELVSPIVTPLVLIFCLRPKASEIVDFYRNFTVEVVGVGDVCSFAEMDVRKHGNPRWHPDGYTGKPKTDGSSTDGGKIELSLLHFTMTNPKWSPPEDSSLFLTAVKTQAQKDMNPLTTVQEESLIHSPVSSLSYGGYTGYGYGAANQQWLISGNRGTSLQFLRGAVSHMEGARHGISMSTSQLDPTASSHGGMNSILSGPAVDPVLAPSSPSVLFPSIMPVPQDLTAIEMRLSTLFMHDLHARNYFRTHASQVRACEPRVEPSVNVNSSVLATHERAPLLDDY